MKYSLILTVATAFFTLTLGTPARHPVCIVGAGPAGLIAANKLEAQGRKVVLFEKQASVGGKCQAIYENGTFHPLGAVVFSNATYTESLKIINPSGVIATQFPSGQSWDFNSTTGATELSPAITAEFVQLVGQEFQRYVVYWNTVFAPYSALRYKNGVPQEFTVSTSQWLASNNFRALPVIFIRAMVGLGYGDLRQVPALYILQYLTPDILGFFARIHPIYLIDFHEVFVRFAKSSVKGPILLNSYITEIDRSGSNPIVRYRQTGSDQNSHEGNDEDRKRTKKQHCSELILAFPPTISALKAANLKLTTDEKTVFGPVGIIDYFSSAVRLSTPRNLLFNAKSVAPNVPSEAVGEPVSFLHLFATSDIATVWSWGPYRGGTTADRARKLLKQTLSKINKDPQDPTAVSKPVTDADILGFQQNDYFPHFDSEQLLGGWYDKFNALQGQKRTYYASGLNGFEIVEFALRAGIDIVETYF